MQNYEWVWIQSSPPFANELLVWTNGSTSKGTLLRNRLVNGVNCVKWVAGGAMGRTQRTSMNEHIIFIKFSNQEQSD